MYRAANEIMARSNGDIDKSCNTSFDSMQHETPKIGENGVQQIRIKLQDLMHDKENAMALSNTTSVKQK